MPPSQKNNLYPNAPDNLYIYPYKGRADRFVAYRRYEDPDYGKTPLNKYKRFQKGCLFYSVSEAQEWLNTLPEKMSRPFRNAPASD